MTEENAPVIITGMHRSGTSLLARLLDDMGLFVGAHKEENHESTFFVNLNKFLLEAAGASWENPETVRHILPPASKKFRDDFKRMVQELMKSNLLIHYFGPFRFMKYRGLQSLEEKWGWKDPRNTLTFPIWKEIFPTAKILHIKRHGLDVAASLKTRSQEDSKRLKDVPYLKKAYLLRYPRRYGLEAPWLENLDNGVELWAFYESLFQESAGKLPETDVLQITFEELVRDPVKTLTPISRWIGLENSQEDLERVSSRVEASRAFSYRDCLADIRPINSETERLIEENGYSI